MRQFLFYNTPSIIKKVDELDNFTVSEAITVTSKNKEEKKLTIIYSLILRIKILLSICAKSHLQVLFQKKYI